MAAKNNLPVGIDNAARISYNVQQVSGFGKRCHLRDISPAPAAPAEIKTNRIISGHGQTFRDPAYRIQGTVHHKSVAQNDQRSMFRSGDDSMDCIHVASGHRNYHFGNFHDTRLLKSDIDNDSGLGHDSRLRDIAIVIVFLVQDIVHFDIETVTSAARR